MSHEDDGERASRGTVAGGAGGVGQARGTVAGGAGGVGQAQRAPASEERNERGAES